jgi:hypothetical protein
MKLKFKNVPKKLGSKKVEKTRNLCGSNPRCDNNSKSGKKINWNNPITARASPVTLTRVKNSPSPKIRDLTK